MQKSVQAALYSALIFPGAGLYWLKRYWLAALFILPSLAITVYLLREALACAYQLSDAISAGSVPLDVMQISQALERTLAQLNARLDSAIGGLIICWLLSIAVSYVAGRAPRQVAAE